MPSKAYLLNKMIEHPRSFTIENFLELVSKKEKEAVNFDDLRNNMRRIYDMNESSLLAESDAMKGGLAGLNEKKQAQRRKRFFNRIRDGKRNDKYKTIVAEGDSWFCFPLYVKDINAWLIEEENINLYSIAAAGDWITNIIYEGKYIEELSLVEPDVFLISGGGNDLIGSYRLSFMINNMVNTECPDEEYLNTCISDAFYAFMWTLRTQYWLLLTGLQKSKKLEKLKVITQGYDYIIPSPEKYRGGDLIQWIINLFTATGDWLHTPLKLKGLHDEVKQQAVMTRFINEVNEMFVWLATYKEQGSDEYKFPNLYHVDCRGVAGGFDGWFDEIHLKSEKFEIVAKAYKHLSFQRQFGVVPYDERQKVVKAVWFNPDRNSQPTEEEKGFAMEKSKQ